jgi:N-glycosylase/DNA lyase
MKSKRGLMIEELRALYARRRPEIRTRLHEFAHVHPTEYSYELAYCLLTPQSSAIHAGIVIEELRRQDFFNRNCDPEPTLRRKDCYIRFHRTKARHLFRAKEQFPEILSHLSNGASSKDVRQWLVANVKGLGWKESSHFLRNIGHRDLAILDRHILRNLCALGVIDDVPKSITAKQYLAIEETFKRFAAEIGIPMDELDLLFWSMETGKILK